MRFTNVDLLRTARAQGHRAGAGTPPAVAFLLSLLVLALGAGPARRSTRKEPLERATVMLAIDVSLSMQADDVAPNRIEAAQEAAKEFVERAAGRATTWAWSRSPRRPTCWCRRPRTAAAVIAGHRRAAAGRGDRDRRGGVHLPGRDPVGAGRRRGRARRRPGSCCSPTATARSGRSIEDAAAAAARRRTCRSPRSRSAPTTASVDISGQLQRVPVDRLALQQLAETTEGLLLRGGLGRAS